MRSDMDTPLSYTPFAMFCCQLDSSLTLISRDAPLIGLLGTGNCGHASDALLDYIDTDYATRTYQDVMRQLSCGDDVKFVFPVLSQAGQFRWLLGRAQRCQHADSGADCLRGVLVDITSFKRQYDKCKHDAEQYRIILEQAGEVMFKWDLSDDKMQFSECWKDKFGYVPRTTNFSNVIQKGGHIHPEDVPCLLRQIAVLRGGCRFLNLEVRIAAADGRWLWCKIRACGIYDTSGMLTHVIGLIVDIDDEKKAHCALQAQAEQDSLTKLTNAHTTRQLAGQYLAGSKDQIHCAMLIIDLDDFKRINDQYGHLFGDEVLIHVAGILKHSFRDDDIVGRIGGEEFLVLMKNVSDHQKVMERCNHLLEAIQASSSACKLTASIGVGIVAGAATSYEELFLRTDEALYQAKHAGKNQYILCK